ncbi:MAG: peptide chain release factor-like protein [Acidobacteriota bacterium]
MSAPATESVDAAAPDPFEKLALECDVEFLRGSGPGGQHRNKVESGVRLTHRPTGIVVVATERRSQGQNRKAAFERLARKLAALARPKKPRRKTHKRHAVREAELDAKHRRSEVKRGRDKVRWE